MDTQSSTDLSWPPQKKLIARILYGAFFASVGMYLMFLTQVLAVDDTSQKTVPHAMVNALNILAGLTFVATLICHKLFQKPASSSPPSQLFFTALIVRFALCESIAIYGLVLGFMGLEQNGYLPFFLVSALAFFMAAPTDGAYERFVEPWGDTQGSSNR